MADPLRPGAFDDLEGTLTGAIDAAMQDQWRAAKGEDLPGGPGEEDRRILFAAVARGMLQFLHDHQADLATTQVRDAAGGHRHQIEFDID